jgi:hypothetical protein
MCDCGQPSHLCECDVVRALTSAPGTFIPSGLRPIQRGTPGPAEPYAPKAQHPLQLKARSPSRDKRLRAAIVDLAEFRERRETRRGLELNTNHTFYNWRGKSPRRAK